MKQSNLRPPESDVKSEWLGLQIAVMDRGWVYVGNVQTIGEYYLIHEASCVRKWGTSKGLGQLARNGPLQATILDPTPLVRAERRAVLFCIQCDEAAWNKKNLSAE